MLWYKPPFIVISRASEAHICYFQVPVNKNSTTGKHLKAFKLMKQWDLNAYTTQ